MEHRVRRVMSLVLWLMAWAAAAAAQQPAAAARPFEIVDNSFLVEEAYNQEPKIFQNIFGFVRSDAGDWSASFTQEWPAPGVRHQLSYTLVFDNDTGPGGLGDLAINYRYQLRTGENGGTAVSPRLSLLLRPNRSDTADAGRAGIELNVPASHQYGDVYLHGNAGMRIYPSVDTGAFGSTLGGSPGARHVSLVSPFLAGSIILRARPMLNLMLESVALFGETIVERAATRRETTLILSPGTRFGWNIGDQQVVLGVAVPFQHGGGETSTGVLGYASWELPFRH
jgi:hypothetical protein